MNDIFNEFQDFTIVYIVDVLVFSPSIEKHFKHVNIFVNIIKRNGFVVSLPKIKIFETKIRFLGFQIHLRMIKLIQRLSEFASNFSNKTQLQRFLVYLNYVSHFILNLKPICKPLYQRLKKISKP